MLASVSRYAHATIPTLPTPPCLRRAPTGSLTARRVERRTPGPIASLRGGAVNFLNGARPFSRNQSLWHAAYPCRTRVATVDAERRRRPGGGRCGAATIRGAGSRSQYQAPAPGSLPRLRYATVAPGDPRLAVTIGVSTEARAGGAWTAMPGVRSTVKVEPSPTTLATDN